jgi:hypothetical protein
MELMILILVSPVVLVACMIASIRMLSDRVSRNRVLTLWGVLIAPLIFLYTAGNPRWEATEVLWLYLVIAVWPLAIGLSVIGYRLSRARAQMLYDRVDRTNAARNDAWQAQKGATAQAHDRLAKLLPY